MSDPKKTLLVQIRFRNRLLIKFKMQVPVNVFAQAASYFVFKPAPGLSQSPMRVEVVRFDPGSDGTVDFLAIA